MDVTHLYTHEYNGCIIKLDINLFTEFDNNPDCIIQAACLPNENAAYKVIKIFSPQVQLNTSQEYFNRLTNKRLTVMSLSTVKIVGQQAAL